MTERLHSHPGFDDPLEISAGEKEAPDTFEGNPAFSRAQLDARAAYWVAEYGGEGTEFTKEQELELSRRIQLGIATRESIDDGTTPLTPDVAQVIRDGERAERALVEANLRFAFMYARESIGLKHEGVLERMTKARSEGEARVRSLGTYRPLSSSRSPRASLEDRYSMAVIGLIKAARGFKPREGRQGKVPRFVGRAAWTIQQEIDRGIEVSEHAGARLPSNVQAKLNSYFGDHPSLTPDHEVPEEIDRLIQLTEPRAYPEGTGRIVEGGIDDLNDPWGEDDRPDGLQDVWDDPNPEMGPLNLADKFADESIDMILDTTLSDERQPGTIRLRFGIGRCACHGVSMMHTLDEIGIVYGVTRERIRQLERRTMAELRHPDRSILLREVLESFEDAQQSPVYTVWRGDAVQSERVVAQHLSGSEYYQDISGLPPVIDEEKYAAWKERQDWLKLQEARDKRWQAFADEAWDEPVREFPFEATPELIEALKASFEEMDAVHFSKSFNRDAGVGVPMRPLTQFNEVLGRGVLTAGQVAELWDAFMATTLPRLQEELEDDLNLDRVGQLFSRIIGENINDNDSLVELRIPESVSGQIGYLASNLGLGRIAIIGDAGNYVAAWNHGYADVTVRGDVGDSAGAMLRDSARLDVSGSAGVNVGVGARNEAEISVGSAKSIGIADETVSIVEHSPRRKGPSSTRF